MRDTARSPAARRSASRSWSRSDSSPAPWPCCSAWCVDGVAMELNAHIPSGPLAEKWDTRKFENRLVNPANKRKYTVIFVGTGLAGAAGAASLAELGYDVKSFCYQD